MYQEITAKMLELNGKMDFHHSLPANSLLNAQRILKFREFVFLAYITGFGRLRKLFSDPFPSERLFLHGISYI